MSDPIKNLTIVGGGTAGWLAAAMISASRNGTSDAEPLNVTLIESPTIPTVGVGEATTLSMGWTLDLAGLDENDFIRHCDVTFKAAVKFIDWDRGADGTPLSYYHPFSIPPYLNGYAPAYHYHRRHKTGSTRSFAHSMLGSCAVLDAMKAPRKPDAGSLDGLFPYAYHVNAGLFAGYLREYCKTIGVTHVLDDVVGIKRDERGFVSSLALERSGDHPVEFVIDCSGFRSLILQQALEEPFVSFQESLPCDRAIPMPVDHPDPDAKLPPFTTSTGLSAGWSWNVPLWSRRGTGYVYSSAHISDDEAIAELAAHNGVAPPDSARPIHMNIGRTRRTWVKNCVGMGLAAGFIEPLESTSIHFVQMSIRWLLDNFPARDCSPALQQNFNGLTANLYEEIRDFIALHYVLTNRDDTPFWRFARDELTCPDRLAGLIELWRHKLPSPPDLPNRNALFSEWSYMYVLFGKRFFDGIDFPSEDAVRDADFDEFLFSVASDKNRLMAEAPDHRSAIARIRGMESAPWYRPFGASADISGVGGETGAIA